MRFKAVRSTIVFKSSHVDFGQGVDRFKLEAVEMQATEPRISEGTLQTLDGRVLPLEWTKVKASVRGPLAQVEVRQSFRNPTNETLEATYLFPLPHQGSVFRMEFRIADRVVKAVVKEKEEARRVYEKARSEGRAATLLEQERPNLFTLSVANISAGATIEVLMEYQEPVAYDFGEWRFAFPMVASERYYSGMPEGHGTTEVADGARIRPPRPRSTERQSPVSLEFELRAVDGRTAPYSPSHAVKVETHGDRFRVSLDPEEKVANRDFVLVWPCQNRGLLPQVWYERALDKPGTFALTIPAPVALGAQETTNVEGYSCGNCGAPMGSKEAVSEIPGLGHAWQCDYCGVYQRVQPEEKTTEGKDVVFLVDLSASVGRLTAAVEAVSSCLSKLSPSDRFRLIAFHHELLELSSEWLPCDETSKVRALEFLEGQKVKGGTELEVALRAAGSETGNGRARVAVLITDGAVGNEGRLLRELPKWLKDTRLYVMGVGNTPNRYLIDKLARFGRGAFEVSQGGEAHLLERFAQRVAQAAPILSNVTVEVESGQGQGMDIYPRGGRELFSGQILRLTGRFIGEGPATLRVRGTNADGTPFLQEVGLTLPEYSQEAPGIERVWARERIEELQDQLVRHPERLSEVRLETLGLALKHHLMSPYTALVADDQEVTVDPEGPSHTVDAAESVGPDIGLRRSATRSAPRAESAPADRPVRLSTLDSARSERKGLVSRTFASEKPTLGHRPMLGARSFPETVVLRSASPPLPPSPSPEAYVDDDCVFEEPFPDGGDLFGAVGETAPEPAFSPVSESSLFDDSESFAAAPDLSVSEGLFDDDGASSAGDGNFDVDHYVIEGLFSGEDEPVHGLFDDKPPASSAPPKRSCSSWTIPSPPPPRGQNLQTPVGLTGNKERALYSAEELARARELVVGRLDLVFLIDETGSMGPYIQEVQERLLELINVLRSSPLCTELRLGLVTFRDHPPQDATFVTRVLPLTSDWNEISAAVQRMRASGGGDGPEAVTDGLHDLLNLDWDGEAARLVVMVGDAPPHGVEPEGDGFPEGCPCGRHWYTQAEGCREMGITVHTVGCRGIRNFRGAEAVFETVAKVTGGLYVALDESWLLIELVSGLADRELDRQRLAQYVAEIYAENRQALDAADLEEQVRFITEVLEQRGLEVLDLMHRPGLPPTFRPVKSEDVALALDALRRRDLAAA